MSYNQFGARGGKFSTAKPKSDVEWAMLRASQIPGPGGYNTEPDRSGGGGKFSTANPKSDVEWKMYTAAKLPGPGQYEVPTGIQGMKGGKFSAAKPKSDVEWMIYRASQTPGPGQYDPVDKKNATGKFSTSKPKSDVEWKIYNASKIPGPGQYDLPDTMAKNGGKIPSSKPKSDVEWMIYRASKLPGPGQYDIDKDKSKSGGGKFSTANPKSDVEWRMYHAARMPGPADYSCDIFTVAGRAGSPSRPTGHASPPKTAASRGAARPQTSLAAPADAAEGDAAVPITPMHAKKPKTSHAKNDGRQSLPPLSHELQSPPQSKQDLGEDVSMVSALGQHEDAGRVRHELSRKSLSECNVDPILEATKARVLSDVKRLQTSAGPSSMVHSIPIGIYGPSPAKMVGKKEKKSVKSKHSHASYEQPNSQYGGGDGRSSSVGFAPQSFSSEDLNALLAAARAPSTVGPNSSEGSKWIYEPLSQLEGFRSAAHRQEQLMLHAQAEVAALARRLAKVNDLSGVSQKFGMLQQQQPSMKQQQNQQQQSLEHAYKPRQFQ